MLARFSNDTFVAKASEASRQTIPPINKVSGVPNLWARTPANKLPNASTPRRAMTNRLITLPRIESSTMVCRIVLLEAICNIRVVPMTTAINNERTK